MEGRRGAALARYLRARGIAPSTCAIGRCEIRRLPQITQRVTFAQRLSPRLLIPIPPMGCHAVGHLREPPDFTRFGCIRCWEELREVA